MNAAFPLCQILESQFSGFSKADNSCDVFRSAASAIFLAAACDQRTKARSPVDIKCAYAFWPMKFVRRKRKKMDRRIAEADRDLSDRLHGVCVKEHTFLATKFGDLFNWK